MQDAPTNTIKPLVPGLRATSSRERNRDSILTCGPGHGSRAEEVRRVQPTKTMTSNDLKFVIEVRVGERGEVDPAWQVTKQQIVQIRCGHSISMLSWKHRRSADRLTAASNLYPRLQTTGACACEKIRSLDRGWVPCA